jgi:fatty acid desaturase
MVMRIDQGSVVRAATIATATVVFAAVGITMIVLSYLQWPNVVSGIVTFMLVSIAIYLLRHLSRNKKHMSQHNREGSSTTTAAPFAHALDASFRQQTLPTSPFLLYEAPVVLAPVLAPPPLVPPPLLPPTNL